MADNRDVYLLKKMLKEEDPRQWVISPVDHGILLDEKKSGFTMVMSNKDAMDIVIEAIEQTILTNSHVEQWPIQTSPIDDSSQDIENSQEIKNQSSNELLQNSELLAEQQ